MRRGGAGILAVALALAGCKSTEPKGGSKEPSGVAASRGKTKDTKDAKEPKQTWIDPTAKLPGADTAVPRSPGWSSDAKAEAQDAVGGKVVDASGRPAKNVFIRVEAVNGPAGTAAMGIYTDNGGYFFTRGLKAGQSYNLSAEATQDGKPLSGSVQTLVPNPVLTIVLRDDFGLPPAGGKTPEGTGTGAFPPPPAESDRIPAVGVGPANPPHTPRPTPTDASFAPGHGATKPVPSAINPPPAIGSPPPPITGGGSPPPPDDLSIPSVRPENVAEGPRPHYTAPPASIPGPPSLPPTPSYPNPAVPPTNPNRERSARTAPGANFTLADTLDRKWEFASDKSGSVVLVEFMTTTCVHCKPVTGVLTDLQSRYGGSGLQVIAVACDDLPRKQRAAAASKYARDYNLNYALLVEPGDEPGNVRDRYDVQGYPTAVLLDGTGAVLWKGHPAERAELENAIKRALGK